MSLSSVHIPSLFSSLCILLSVKYAKCKTILRKLVRFSVQKLRLSISRLPTCLREKKPFPHHVVYDNYVAIEIIIFLTQS